MSRMGGVYWLWLIVAVQFVLVQTVSAQEALQNSITGQNNAESRTKQLQSQDYTIKYGDFRMLISGGAVASWNDNINLSKNNLLEDYILTPAMRVTSSYPFTQKNVLFLDVSVGYSRYLKHPKYSTFDLNSSSGTGISFDIGIQDVTLNIHDWMHYIQDAAQNSAVANTATYGTFNNTAGVSAAWNLNQITLSGGYDHQNVISTSADFDNITRQSDLFFLRSSAQVHPQVSVGLETTATLTTYSQDILNNNDAYTAGAFTEYRPDSALKVTVRGGYATYQFQQSSASIKTSSQNSYYASLAITHQPCDSMDYTLEAGREVRLGVQSDLTEDWYVRPNINWNFIRGLGFNTALFYEHGKQGIGNVSGNLIENYDWYGGELTVNHELTSRLTVGLNYRLTVRTSDISNNEYAQNLVGVHLTYFLK